MSHDGINSIPREDVPRFWGAQHMDDIAYATINLAEAIVGFLTLGKWYPTWAFWYCCEVQDKLFLRVTREAR